jgi:hypothetical protein
MKFVSCLPPYYLVVSDKKHVFTIVLTIPERKKGIDTQMVLVMMRLKLLLKRRFKKSEAAYLDKLFLH